MPEYLARYYWWAYLWRWGVWFFDHQPIINAILFGQYHRLMRETLSRYHPEQDSRTLQLTCVYGKLIPSLLKLAVDGLHVADVAPQQLNLARRKTSLTGGKPIYPARMNAECLAYADDVFDHVILFFLLHEMPSSARKCTLAEMLRVIRPGGQVLITEYAPLPVQHWLYRYRLFRWVLGRLEPFLPGFWQDNLDDNLQQAALQSGKCISRVSEAPSIFSGFYRVVEYRVETGANNTSNKIRVNTPRKSVGLMTNLLRACRVRY